ncbi:hypothetical protein GIB67_023750 [Kingdonia uniflora]|uniref:PORR domain-containing protein n=1 Tax=Kingdonia uniflora TaxID=39325 RepID=A0A7J7LG84_9MAGN|nr:hypothetical protein GIB67_023750 [Kingdonia uniflora]
MSSRFLSISHLLNPNPNFISNLIKPNFLPFSTTSFLRTKLPFTKKRKKNPSPRTKLIQAESFRLHRFEELVKREAVLQFVTRSKDYLSKQPHRVIRLDDAGKLHREMGFPRGRKVVRSIERHSLLFQTYRHVDGKMWIGFTDFMEELLEEERVVMDSMEEDRVTKVRKLLMMSVNKRIPLSKIYHCRSLFGIPEDFRDRVVKYPNYFRVVVESDGKRILELVDWDPKLAISTLERDFILEEDRVKRAFKFREKYTKSLHLDDDDRKKLNLLKTLPLVSPYSDGAELKLWSLEAEKYRLGVLHEFLNLTLEKRASIHHIVEFKEEFILTKHTYVMLLKQPRTFCLAGTEMNWAVFLREGYTKNGDLIEKDPQVVFNEKLYRYAQKNETEMGIGNNEERIDLKYR